MPEDVAEDMPFGAVALLVVVADAVQQDRCFHWKHLWSTQLLAAMLGVVVAAAVETAAIGIVATEVAVAVD